MQVVWLVTEATILIYTSYIHSRKNLKMLVKSRTMRSCRGTGIKADSNFCYWPSTGPVLPPILESPEIQESSGCLVIAGSTQNSDFKVSEEPCPLSQKFTSLNVEYSDVIACRSNLLNRPRQEETNDRESHTKQVHERRNLMARFDDFILDALPYVISLIWYGALLWSTNSVG
jgi:hypothetical protein